MLAASRCSTLLAVLMLAVAGPVFAGATAYTDTDNEDNAGNGVPDGDMDVTVGRNNPLHPIEFNINVAAVPTTSAIIPPRVIDAVGVDLPPQ